MDKYAIAMKWFDLYKKHCRAKYALVEIRLYNKNVGLAMVDMEHLREYVHIDVTASKKEPKTGGLSLRFRRCADSDKMLRRNAVCIVDTGMTEAAFDEWAKADPRHYDTWEDGTTHLNRGQAGEHWMWCYINKGSIWKRDNAPHWKRGDIVFNGKSCQIKMHRGTLLTKTEAERW